MSNFNMLQQTKRAIVISFTDIDKTFATSRFFDSIFIEKGSTNSAVYHYKDLAEIEPVINAEQTVLIFTGHHSDPKVSCMPVFSGDGFDGSYDPIEVFGKIQHQLKQWPHRTLFHNCYSAGLDSDMTRGVCYRLLNMIQNPAVLTYCYFNKAPRLRDSGIFGNRGAFEAQTPNLILFKWLDGKVVFSNHNRDMTVKQIVEHLYNHTVPDVPFYPVKKPEITMEIPKPLPLAPPLGNSKMFQKRRRQRQNKLNQSNE